VVVPASKLVGKVYTPLRRVKIYSNSCVHSSWMGYGLVPAISVLFSKWRFEKERGCENGFQNVLMFIKENRYEVPKATVDGKSCSSLKVKNSSKALWGQRWLFRKESSKQSCIKIGFLKTTKLHYPVAYRFRPIPPPWEIVGLRSRFVLTPILLLFLRYGSWVPRHFVRLGVALTPNLPVALGHIWSFSCHIGQL
jgi:hypothetical protein